MRCDFVLTARRRQASSGCPLHPSNSPQSKLRSDRVLGDGALPFWFTSGLAWTVIRLDAVSVWINDEGGVVVGAINRAKTGRTIVMPARAQRRRMKCIYGGG